MHNHTTMDFTELRIDKKYTESMDLNNDRDYVLDQCLSEDQKFTIV